MKINYFCNEYTHGKVYFNDIIDEVQEFFEELVKWDKEGMKDEFADVISFFQMWLWDQFKINGKLWKLGMRSFNKFISREKFGNKFMIMWGLKKNVLIVEIICVNIKLLNIYLSLILARKKHWKLMNLLF